MLKIGQNLGKIANYRPPMPNKLRFAPLLVMRQPEVRNDTSFPLKEIYSSHPRDDYFKRNL